MPRPDDLPATKADVQAVREELGAVKTELKGDIKRVAIELVKTNETMAAMEGRLSAGMRQLNDNVTATLDGFVHKMETIWKESATITLALDKHGETLKNHEGRIKVLESPRR